MKERSTEHSGKSRSKLQRGKTDNFVTHKEMKLFEAWEKEDREETVKRCKKASRTCGKRRRLRSNSQIDTDLKHFHQICSVNMNEKEQTSKIERIGAICKSAIKDTDIYYIADSRIHGYGLFARQKIPKGTNVIEYIGEYIGKCVSDKREKVYRENGINSIYMFSLSKNVIIDSTMKGNAARFINHSCNPNCKGVIKKSTLRVVYVAVRYIEVNEELTIDYNVSGDDEDEKLECNCGYEQCLKRYG